MSTGQSGLSNNAIYKELKKNINLLMKVIEVEDESMRSTCTKVIDVVAQEESRNDSNHCSNKYKFGLDSSKEAIGKKLLYANFKLVSAISVFPHQMIAPK